MNTINRAQSSVKSVAADQIKRACQIYWGGGGPPAPPHSTAPLLLAFKISVRF